MITSNIECPYCKVDKNNKNIKFSSWKNVRGHCCSCLLNNHNYIITDLYGPIHYSELTNNTLQYLKNKYPKLNIFNCIVQLKKHKVISNTFTYKTVKWPKEDIIKAFSDFFKENNRPPKALDMLNNNKLPGASTFFRCYTTVEEAILDAGIPTDNCKKYWNKELIIKSIQQYYQDNNTIPHLRDFKYLKEYPDPSTIQKHFKSWNNAILAAGFSPNIQNGFGIDTYGLDGHLYRSRAEAYFADTYLYSKYNYIVEPTYPSPYNRKKYDWFIEEINLYIELDGGLRPEAIKEKTSINNQLNRQCLYITTASIYNTELINSLLKNFINIK